MTLFSNVNWLPLFALTCTSFSPFFHHSLRHLAQAKKLRPPSDGLSVSPLKWQLSNCRNWVTQLFDFSAIKYILFKKKSHALLLLFKPSRSIYIYSSPRLVVDWMEELIVGLLLVENAWCQKQSWSFMHLLCSGMVGFGLR